jgi:DnaJ-class molecular chaperone
MSLKQVYPPPCEWCGGTGLLAPGGWTRPCPRCHPEKYEGPRPLAPAIEAFLRSQEEER